MLAGATTRDTNLFSTPWAHPPVSVVEEVSASLTVSVLFSNGIVFFFVGFVQRHSDSNNPQVQCLQLVICKLGFFRWRLDVISLNWWQCFFEGRHARHNSKWQQTRATNKMSAGTTHQECMNKKINAEHHMHSHHMHAHAHTHTHTHTHARTRAHAHAHARTRTCTRARARTRTRAHAHARTHTHTRTTENTHHMKTHWK